MIGIAWSRQRKHSQTKRALLTNVRQRWIYKHWTKNRYIRSKKILQGYSRTPPLSVIVIKTTGFVDSTLTLTIVTWSISTWAGVALHIAASAALMCVHKTPCLKKYRSTSRRTKIKVQRHWDDKLYAKTLNLINGHIIMPNLIVLYIQRGINRNLIYKFADRES